MSRPNEGQGTERRSRRGDWWTVVGVLAAAVVITVILISIVSFDWEGSNDQAADPEASPTAAPTWADIVTPEPTPLPHPDFGNGDELAEAEAAWDVEDELEGARRAREAQNLVQPIEQSFRFYGAPAELAIRELVDLSCRQSTSNPAFWERADDLYGNLWVEVAEGVPDNELTWPPTLAEAWSQNCDS